MSGKIIYFWLSLFLLALGSGSICVAVEPPKFANMAETLSQQWNERLLKKMIHVPSTEIIGACGGIRLNPMICGCFHGWGGGLLLSLPTSQFRFSDPLSPFLNALSNCTRVKITSIESTLMLPPHLASVFYDRLHQGYRILNRTETTDTFPALHCFRLLTSVLMSDKEICFEPAESLENEIDSFRPSRFSPSIIIEYEGNHWLRVEIFIEAQIAVVRTQEKWGGYKLTPADTKFLEAGINDLHAIYANQSTEK